MGRSPCCSKVGLNKGVWTSAEDKILTDYIQLHGEGRWRNLPKNAGLKRCGKSCRLRWLNYLRPDIKRGNISEDEEDLIIRLHKLLGNRWSLIAGRLPGRTDNEIKNYWNTTLRKKAHDNHTNSVSSPPKTPTKQNNKRKYKKKRDPITHEPNLDSQLLHTPSLQSTESSSSRKSTDDHSLDEPPIEPKDDNIKPTQNLEPSGIDSSDICLTKLDDFPSLFGSNNYICEDNEIKSMSASSSYEILDTLEEFWNVENLLFEPNIGSCNDLYFASTSECIEDWLL